MHTHLALCMYVCTACTSVFVGTTCALFFTLMQMFERKKKPFKVIVEGVGGWALCSKTAHLYLFLRNIQGKSMWDKHIL